VRLIDESGGQLGVFSLREALATAQARDLDLVEVAPQADPPVCRMMDYGKFLYQHAKKERGARRAQKSVEVKEVRLRPKIGEHDRIFKTKRMRDFIEDGSRVKVRVRFRGREITHPEIARRLLERIADDLADVATPEGKPAMEGRSMLMILAPIKGK